MEKILGFLQEFNEIKVIRFTDEMLNNLPIEDWPRVDVIIGFYSFGFPLEKAQMYKPKMINDLTNQSILWSREKVINMLQKAGIPTAKSFYVNRSKNANKTREMVEQEAKDSRNRTDALVERVFNEQAQSSPNTQMRNLASDNLQVMKSQLSVDTLSNQSQKADFFFDPSEMDW
eukprot:CAMPEP_0176344774 /NCGR_PEP_ID=MMETSP0126-20121128/4948_1 /TAXON_ID=141414 ORGANISM="Strombidinopsis acuminatum, Strain SPMC142" /NCGR_SAMPLE_ID=MMETSP0126 /ASSEMBLY_ACC=CAM_ASM_000229 /LENGTH=173 /DNA_ID=CAMNT_0017691395 /DNA_START=323 /DNA_END=841 /DNA_ORIENTATION=+